VENIVSGKQGKFKCWNCSSYCLLAKPCCTPEDDFSDVYCVSTAATLIKCPKCDKHLRYLLCCKQFLPFDATDNVLKCLRCDKLSMECKCNSVNLLPGKELAFNCKATFTDLRNFMRNFSTFSLACLFYVTFGPKSFVHR